MSGRDLQSGGVVGNQPTGIVVVAVVAAALLLTMVSWPDEDARAITGQLVSGGGVPTTTLPDPVDTWGDYRDFATVAGTGLANGRTRIEQSLGCEAGGDGDYWHFASEDALSPGVITGPESTLPGDLRLYADVHSPHHGVRASPEPVPGPDTSSAMLLPDASHVSLSNQRGTIKLGLRAGGCPRRDEQGTGYPLDFDGITAATTPDGPGVWEIISASGSYRQAQDDGTGTFDLTANVSPGADNPWTLGLSGAIRVLQPDLHAHVVDTYWGRDGLDYALRRVSVVYDITNIGSGDAFDVRLIGASSPTPGASMISIVINGTDLLIDGNTPVGSPDRSLGDLASLETERITVTWQLPLPAGDPPCELVILGCEIDTTLTFSVPDAMDVPVSPDPAPTVTVAAPDLPPPGS